MNARTNHSIYLRMAASSLILASMAGCSGIFGSTADSAANKPVRLAVKSAERAEDALRGGKVARAVEMAEAAVAGDNANPGYRALLGQAYLAAGRYNSARMAFEDALRLGDASPRTVINLALIRTAQGEGYAGRQLLVDNSANLPVSDYGLAMAMAGDSKTAVRILSQAVEDPAGGAQARQNLAYAFALNGQWQAARMMAQQDLAPEDAAKRVIGWAAMAAPGNETRRVYAMLGSIPDSNDAGMPLRLALKTEADAPETAEQATRLAMSEAAPIAPVEIEPVPEGAAIAHPEPVVFTPPPSLAAASAQPRLDVPIIRAPAEPARIAAPAPVARPAVASKAAAAPVAAQPAGMFSGPVDPARGSRWVVQLGAYSSPASAKVRWNRLSGSVDGLSAYPSVYSMAQVEGRTFHRLAVAGFASRTDAQSMCTQIRAQGNACFVRMGGAEATPAKWAAALKASRQIAMR